MRGGKEGMNDIEMVLDIEYNIGRWVISKVERIEDIKKRIIKEL